MLTLLLEIVGLICAHLALRRRPMAYQLACLIIYLVAVTLVGTLDYTFPPYFLAACLPLVPGLRIRAGLSLTAYLVAGAYLLVGVLFQDVSGTFVGFLTRTMQLLLPFVVMENFARLADEEPVSTRYVWVAVAAESLLGVLLLVAGLASGADEIRLVSNSQPITGNMAICIAPVILELYFRNGPNQRRAKRSMALASLVLLFWAVLSGTRGYMLMFGLGMLPLWADFLGVRFVRGTLRVSARAAIFAVAGLAVVVLVITNGSALVVILSVLGLGRGMGIRTYENALVADYYPNASLLHQLVGIGLGGTGDSDPAFLEALDTQTTLGMWNYEHYLTAAGAQFHNFYATVLLCQGLVGVALVVVFAAYSIAHIRASIMPGSIRAGMLLLFIGFLIMVYYRWSASCGVAEMILLFMTVRRMRARSSGLCPRRSVDIPTLLDAPARDEGAHRDV